MVSDKTECLAEPTLRLGEMALAPCKMIRQYSDGVTSFLSSDYHRAHRDSRVPESGCLDRLDPRATTAL
jgi:hypothetical protein